MFFLKAGQNFMLVTSRDPHKKMSIHNNLEKAPEIIYLDYQSTTPVDERVLKFMLPFFKEKFANPHSVQHFLGREADAAVEEARNKVASLIGADNREIVFTSGATESNNLAIKGAARFYHSTGRNQVVTLATEHKCVLESVLSLKEEGFEVFIVPVKKDGIVDIDVLSRFISGKTALVSVMAVNNEIGVIQPIREIGALCRKVKALFHTDAAQAGGKIPLDVNAMHIDFLSLSSHKMYGPKGIGALFVRRHPRARLEPIFSGGGQERGLRSGTLPTQLCVGFGEACKISGEEMDHEAERIRILSSRFMHYISQSDFEIKLNGSKNRRWQGNLNLLFAGTEAEAVINSVETVCISSGSACSDASLESSYVLRAIGLGEIDARASLRISFGRMTSEDEVIIAAQRIISAVRSVVKKPKI